MRAIASTIRCCGRQTAGTHTLTAMVSDSDGQSATATATVTIGLATTYGVMVSSPTYGATASSPVHVLAAASATKPNDRAFCEAATRSGILLAPGDCFDTSSHFRLGFAAAGDNFSRALPRFGDS